MPDLTFFELVLVRLPVPGRLAHRRALMALAAGRWRAADRMCEGAASGYRRELDVRGVARARVHQMMARALAGGGREPALTLAIECALSRLDVIEAPSPPFATCRAHELFGRWQAGAATRRLAA